MFGGDYEPSSWVQETDDWKDPYYRAQITLNAEVRLIMNDYCLIIVIIIVLLLVITCSVVFKTLRIVYTSVSRDTKVRTWEGHEMGLLELWKQRKTIEEVLLRFWLWGYNLLKCYMSQLAQGRGGRVLFKFGKYSLKQQQHCSKKSLCWLVWGNLTKSKVTQEEGTSVKELSPSD